MLTFRPFLAIFPKARVWGGAAAVKRRRQRPRRLAGARDFSTGIARRCPVRFVHEAARQTGFTGETLRQLRPAIFVAQKMGARLGSGEILLGTLSPSPARRKPTRAKSPWAKSRWAKSWRMKRGE
jgi:hypothetical protein